MPISYSSANSLRQKAALGGWYLSTDLRVMGEIEEKQVEWYGGWGCLRGSWMCGRTWEKDQATIGECSESNTGMPSSMEPGKWEWTWPIHQSDLGSHWRVLSPKMDVIRFTVSQDHFVGLPRWEETQCAWWRQRHRWWGFVAHQVGNDGEVRQDDVSRGGETWLESDSWWS